MQRILLPFGGPLLCIALTVGLLLAGKASISGAQTAASPELTLETPDMGDVPSLGEDETANGSGDATETPDPASGSLSEDDAVPLVPSSSPPEPPSTVTASPLPPPGLPPASQSEALEETILRHPIALAAGLVQFGDRTIQLADLKPQAAERVCAQTTGTWPCGAVARTAFRNFIRARAFTCQTPKGGWTGTTTARCTVGPDDPAVWLARNGWAEPEETADALLDATQAARQTGKGFYRKPSAQSAPSPPPSPTSSSSPTSSPTPSPSPSPTPSPTP